MAFKKYHIMLVPEDIQRVKNFHLSSLFLTFVGLFLIFSCLVFVWVAWDYHQLKTGLPSKIALQKDIQFQKMQFNYLARRIEQISQKVHEMREFDRRLRGMVNLDEQDKPAGSAGVGGSEPETVNAGYAAARSHRNLVKSMHLALDELDDAVLLGKQEKETLQRFLENQQKLIASTPSIWPTKGWLSSRFGYRRSPFTGKREFHRGVDISARMKAPIVAPADGVVVSVKRNRGYGKTLTITHGNGLVTRYAHLNAALVKKGKSVRRGETIALVGTSGRSTGPHLHYEVRLNGAPVNPLPYMNK